MGEDTETYVPPHSIEAEQAVLGAIFVEPAVVPLVAVTIDHPKMFWRVSHQHIWQAILNLYEQDHPIDWVTVAEEVRRLGGMEDCGGGDALHTYLADISNSVPSSYGAERYASIVKERALMRAVIRHAYDIRATALSPTESAGSVIGKFLEDAQKLADLSKPKKLISAADMAQKVIITHAERKELADGADYPLIGVSSGFKDLDLYTGGLAPGELTVLGGRPGQGKTTLALCLALNVARGVITRESEPVLIFSLEVSAFDVFQKIICAMAGVEFKALRLGKLNNDEEVRAEQAADELADLPIYVDDSPGLTMHDIAARARVAVELGAKLIVTDHLQEIRQHSAHVQRYQYVGDCARTHHRLARELGISVVLLSQLKREAETKTKGRGKQTRPTLSDLRESGDIEQTAENVWLIHSHGSDDTRTADVDLIVAKQRNGPTGVVPLVFQKWCSRFKSAPERDEHGNEIPDEEDEAWLAAQADRLAREAEGA